MLVASLRTIPCAPSSYHTICSAPKNSCSSNHTDCGLMNTSEEDLRNRIQNLTGTAAVALAYFYSFQNIEENVRHQLQKLRTHPWIPRIVAIRGFVYDVATGLLREIKDASGLSAPYPLAVASLGMFLRFLTSSVPSFRGRKPALGRLHSVRALPPAALRRGKSSAGFRPYRKTNPQNGEDHIGDPGRQ